VNLVDANNHPPAISFRYLPDQTQPHAVVEVGAEAGASVAAITVTDPDQGKHGRTRLDLVSGNNGNNFRLDTFGSLSVIRVAPGARFNPSDVFNLTVRATDLGSPPRSALASLAVVVDAGNARPPAFEAEIYAATLSEDAPVGTSVLAVKAADPDDRGRTGKEK